MRKITRSVALAGVLCSLIATPQLFAVAAFTSPQKGKERMLDARLNRPDVYAKVTARRADAVRSGFTKAKLKSESIAAAIADLEKARPGIVVQMSGMTGAPELIRMQKGTLTGNSSSSNESIVRNFISANAAVYGLSSADISDLKVLGDSRGGTSGLRMLRMEQQIDGLPVFQSESRFIIDRQGRLVQGTGNFIPSARESTPNLMLTQFMDPRAAIVKLLGDAGISATADSFAVEGEAPAIGNMTLSENDEFVAGDITARKVLFPLAPGVLVPAWSVVVFTVGDADWYAVIDADSGEVLWRKNIRNYASAHDARFRVYVAADGVTPAANPAPNSTHAVVNPGSGTQFPGIAPTIVSMHTAYDPVASQNGWINDCPGGVCTAAESQTIGNNVVACLDAVVGGNANICDTAAGSVLDGSGRPTGNPDANSRNRDFLGTTPRDFQTNYLPPPQGGNPEAGQTATGTGSNGTAAIDQFRRGVVTHLFYVSNWYHDKLYALGFDEAAANFQLTNFSGFGLGNDRVAADVADAASVDNANFATPPDGTAGRMQMFRFTGPTIDRDGSLDAEISIHELTHGTSNRLVGNAAGLNWDPAIGMGEGWSDFYALSLLYNTNADDPNLRYASGGYATYKLAGLAYLDNYVYGIRRFPYSTDNSVNPMTWADVDDVTNNLSGGITPTPISFNLGGGFEVHNIGELWALSLWEVRARVIADPAAANGDVPSGNHTMLQLTTDALKATPINPGFIEARDAFFTADCATNSCANEQWIWAGFADRGLGYRAESPYRFSGRYVASHGSIKESFSLPYLDVINPLTDVIIDDSATNNNGAIDPGEPIRITVELTNPWRAASKSATGITATLTTSTPGVTIYDNTAVYPTIAPQAFATGDQFMFTVASSVLAGTQLKFTVTTTSSLGTTSTNFSLRVGTRNGTDPVVTYTGDPSPDLTILNDRPRGVFHQINVTDDYEIADVDFRVNSITTVAAGDLSVLLRSPEGIGTDLIVLIDGLNDLGGPAITNMLIDGDAPNDAAHDMVQATNAQSPYTGTWRPVYNAQWPVLVSPTRPADPVDSLGRYDGRSSQGTWSALAADIFALVDGGTDGNSSFNSWSMLITPVHFDVSPVAALVNAAATKTVSGTFQVGGTVTYTVTITNSGTTGQPDNAGDEFTDTLPAGLTLVSANATSGTASTAGNTVSWNGTLAPLGGSVTITITATVNAGTAGTTISNQGTVNYDSTGDGSNESTQLTDDPSVGGATDPTTFVVAGSLVTGTKTVSGSTTAGSTITYTVTLTNGGTGTAGNNPGSEFTDILPSSLTLVSANATSGSTLATVGTNTVTWDGSLAAGGSVTITITATINSVAPGTTISNQGSISYDADLNGTNEASGVTDDPGVGGAADPTSFQVGGTFVSGTKTVAGTFAEGGTVTYTVTLTNGGTVVTVDNAGNEFTDTLPASLTLVSASASAGTASTAGNTVNWNGAIAGSGSVTITITATINAGTIGTTISNQGTINYDADGNGSNETSATTDDPGVGGANDPTSFVVNGATVTATKTVSGTFSAGGSIVYTITISNSGNIASPDNAGDELTDVLPSTLTLVSASASSGTAVATVGTNTVTWNGAVPAGGSVTITINATINAGTNGQTIANQATVNYDADGNGSNESTTTTDDPAVAGTGNPTTFAVSAPVLSATKTVGGNFSVGGAITYTITISNSGTVASPDNVGNEFTDVLPTQVTLVSANASSGTAVASIGTNTVTWNGSVPAGGSVTITINATVDADAAGQTVSNQGNVSYDSDLNGSNETTVPTDNPSTGAAGDPTTFVAAAAEVAQVPTLSEWALLMLALSLAVVALRARLS